MSHVDDGRLEAWLDRDRSGMTGDEEVAITRHLETCAACSHRLEIASRARSGAASILEGSPLADGPLPDFERVRARAAGGSAGHVTRRTGIRPLVRLAWAASLVAAIGVGWMTRDLLAPRQLAYEDMSGSTASSVSDAEMVGSGGIVNLEGAGNGARLESMGASTPVASPPAPSSPAAAVEAVRPEGPGAAASASAAAGPSGEQPVSADVPGVISESAAISAVAAADIGSPTDEASSPPRGLVARGRVVAAGGTPIAGAIVRIGGAAGTITDSDGRYSLSLSEEQVARVDDTNLTAESLGYGRGSLAIGPPDGDTIVADFELHPTALAFEGIVAVGYSGAPAPAAAPPSTIPGAPDAGARFTGSLAPEVGPAPALRQMGATAEVQMVEASPSRETVTAEEAARRLGTALVALPDLETLSIEWLAAADGAAVHLRQRMADGGTLLLVQSPGSAPVAAPIQPEMTVVNVRRGDLHISARAAMPAEALGALLQGLR